MEMLRNYSLLHLGAQDSKPQPQIYTGTYTCTFPYLPYMYEMRWQLLWHIRILPGLSFISLYYTPICVIIEAEEISFWAWNRNWAVSCYSVHEENYYEIWFGQLYFLILISSPTLLIFQKMHKGKHGQTIIFGLSPYEWGAQLGKHLHHWQSYL